MVGQLERFIMKNKQKQGEKMNYDNKKIIVSVSGGKDSTAMCLNLLEQGYTKNDFIRVFSDTGWEHKSTYEYLNELEKTIGKITRLKNHIEVKPEYEEIVEYFEKKIGWESPFIRELINYQFFPKGFAKWCTRKLKIEVFQEYFDQLDDDYLNLVGIRKEESLRRANMKEWEYHDNFDCWQHRPLIDWTEKDVIDIHHRFNLIPNRLYLNGSSRVGCYPCIYAKKEEIRILDQERINLIQELEEVVTDLCSKKNGDKSPRTFFSPKYGMETFGIQDVHEWSKTKRGGKQFLLFSTEEPTCIKWGMCEFK
jgi:3'-phosphoadenosine 5'-phosphosulfate sulfotransferase (PAPS reductase)/FAD synthetase